MRRKDNPELWDEMTGLMYLYPKWLEEEGTQHYRRIMQIGEVFSRESRPEFATGSGLSKWVRMTDSEGNQTVFHSIKECANYLNANYDSLGRYLKGRYKNKHEIFSNYQFEILRRN